VVSTCAELSCPWLRYPELANALHHTARRAGVSVIGTGVNPGFSLDRLVATAGAASGNVRHVHAVRVVDISNRREAMLRKAGVGLSAADFQTKASSNQVGHIGLIESAVLVARALDLMCDSFEEHIDPVIAQQSWNGPILLHPGYVAGYY